MKRLWLLSVMLLVMLLAACSNAGGSVEEFDEVSVDTSAESSNGEDASTQEDITEDEDVEGALEDVSADSEEVVEEVVYEQAYDFTLTDWQDNEVTLSDYEGKIVFLNVFTTWCTYCDQEMPVFQENYDAYQGDVVFLLVDYFVSERDPESYVKSWYQERGYTMPMVIDLEGALVTKYPVRAFPTTYIIDRLGRNLGAVEGKMTAEMVEMVVEQVNELTP